MDAVCLGELLVDLVCPDMNVPLTAAERFVRAPGGAPANVAVGLARLGYSVGFVGAVGADPFGEWLAQVVAGEGVDVSRLVRHPTARTTLAFIATRGDGRKEISFYRHPGADMMLRPEDIDPGYLGGTRLFHFCSVSLSREPARTATFTAAEAARAAGALVSFDPNWRAPLWDDPDEGRAQIARGLALADIVKVADEELSIVCGTDNPQAACERLLEHGARLAVVTFGPGGSAGCTAGAAATAAGYAVQPVDPLGAGDAFVAALLGRVLETGCPTTADALGEMLRFANAAGALATQNIGVIPALPRRPQIEEFLATTPIRP